MQPPFRAYKGADPFAFVCYAHADSDLVYPDITWLNHNAIKIWYDEGIAPGAVWRDAIADTIIAADLFVVFLSPGNA